MEDAMHRVDTMLQLRLSGPPQRAAVQHMVQRELMHEPEGGILNIEAGFGKTFVVMALMHALPKPTVLVTEPSLVPQLCSELRTWLGPEGFTVCDYVSMSRDDCVDLGLGLQDHTKGQAGRIALVLPYTQTARVNVALRTRAPWGRIIADEVHKVRNGGAFFEGLCAFRNIALRWGLSGTVVQNSWRDIQYPLAWALGHVAGARPTLLGRDAIMDVVKAKSAFYVDTFASVVEHLQGDLQQAYTYTTQTVVLQYTQPEEWVVHDAIVANPRAFVRFQKARALTAAPATAARKVGAKWPLGEHMFQDPSSGSSCEFLDDQAPMVSVPALAHEAVVANVTAAVSAISLQVREHIDRNLQPGFEEAGRQARQAARHMSLAGALATIRSAHPRFVPTKLRWIMEHVRQFRDDAIVIFCSYTEEIHTLFAGLNKVEGRVVYKVLGEGMSARTRAQHIELFRRDARESAARGAPRPILVAQIKVGGTGLNLQDASVCYITCPHWNPSVDEQALKRVYRTKQTRRVQCFRVFMKDTVEERVVQLQASKASMQLEFSDVDVACYLDLPFLPENDRVADADLEALAAQD